MGHLVSYTPDDSPPVTLKDAQLDPNMFLKNKDNLDFDVTDITITEVKKDKIQFEVSAKVTISRQSAHGMRLTGYLVACYDTLPATTPDGLADALRALFVQETGLMRAGTAFPRE